MKVKNKGFGLENVDIKLKEHLVNQDKLDARAQKNAEKRLLSKKKRTSNGNTPVLPLVS